MAVGTEDKGKVRITWKSIPGDDSEGTYVTIYCHVEVTDNNKPSNITDIDNADKYVFEVRRYKDKATKEEYLNARAYVCWSVEVRGCAGRYCLTELLGGVVQRNLKPT